MATYTDITINQDTGIGSGKIDGILFSSVNLANGFKPINAPKIAHPNSVFSPEGNQTDQTLIINAVDIDWNGAKPEIGETSDGITTTGELLKLIKSYADKKLDSVPVATSSVYGGFKLGFPQSDNNYAVQLDRNDRAYVNVPQTTYKAGTNIGIGTVDAGTSNISSGYIIGNPSALTIYHKTPENASEGQKGNKSNALLATITTDAQGHVTGYEEISPAELWRLLQQYADALYQPKPVEVMGISLNRSDVTVPEGTTAMIIATISPSNATNTTVNWTSSNDSIATVTSHTTSGYPANVSFKTTGTVTITATADGNTSKTATCQVTCESPQPDTTYYYSAGIEQVTVLNYTTANGAQSVTNVNDIPDSLDISSISRKEAYFVLPNGLTPIVKTSANLPVTILTVATINNHTIYKTDGKIGSGSTCTISK